MTKFAARELYQEDAPPPPGNKTPAASVEHLRPLGANEFYPRVWQYLHEKHTLADFRRQGYFCDEARSHLREGDTIHYTLCGGSKIPSEWQRGIAIVEELPNTRELPAILCGLVEYPAAKAWRD